MMDDMAEFTDRALACLPEAIMPAGLRGKLLAAYDARQSRMGLWARFCEIVWPGAPVWAPASAFAAALLLGLVLGAVVPTMANDGVTRFLLDQPASFNPVPAAIEEDL